MHRTTGSRHRQWLSFLNPVVWLVGSVVDEATVRVRIGGEEGEWTGSCERVITPSIEDGHGSTTPNAQLRPPTKPLSHSWTPAVEFQMSGSEYLL